MTAFDFIYYLDSDMVAWAREIDNGNKHLAIFHSRDITSEDWEILE